MNGDPSTRRLEVIPVPASKMAQSPVGLGGVRWEQVLGRKGSRLLIKEVSHPKKRKINDDQRQAHFGSLPEPRYKKKKLLYRIPSFKALAAVVQLYAQLYLNPETSCKQRLLTAVNVFLLSRNTFSNSGLYRVTAELRETGRYASPRCRMVLV